MSRLAYNWRCPRCQMPYVIRPLVCNICKTPTIPLKP
jgi:hypothetical protein